MKLFPQPEALHIHETRTPVDGVCERCGVRAIARYRVVDYRGWLQVEKCGRCLATRRSERIEPPSNSGAI